MAEKIAYEIEIKNLTQVTKLKDELKKLRKQNKLLEKDTKQNTKAGRIAAKQYDINAKAIGNKSTKLRVLNKELRGSTTVTKKATKSNNSMAKQFIKGAAAIGIVVGAFRAVNRIVSSVVNVFTEFEFVMAKVNAVSGATEKEFSALTETAEELGRTTFFTAAQVGELMLNFSKLGFTASEIQDAVQPTLDLATATGSDLARAALVAGAAVRGFGLDASETQRVVDVMAVSFSSSAMNIEKWQTSMTKVAPIAKAAGFSIEDTAAIMSKLTDSGIEASIAGTSLRNILLKMQDPTSELSMRFGKTIHSLDELVPAMKQFVAEGGSMADVMEVVDLRQAAAFEQMLTTADGTLALRDSLLEANGEGARMAAIIGDTLQGAFLKFTSAMQGLGISIMKDFAGNLQEAVEGVAVFMNKLAANSKTIVKVINGLTKLIKWFGIYKITLLAVSGYTIAYNKVLVIQRWMAIKAAAGMTTLATATLVAKRAIQSLISATGIGLAIVVLSELIPWLLKTEEETVKVADATEVLIGKYQDSIKPIEDLKQKGKELIRVKTLMNEMLDEEGNLLDNTSVNQKIYNKYKGQAAILMRAVNKELKDNDQALITEKTSIDGLSSSIDALTESLTTQALVKGFTSAIEGIAELAANATIAQEKMKSYLAVQKETLTGDIGTDMADMTDAKFVEMIDFFEKLGVVAIEAADGTVHFIGGFKEMQDIITGAGFKDWDDLKSAISDTEQNTLAVTKAFERLGLDFDLLSTKFKGKGDGPDLGNTVTNWAELTKLAINQVKQSKLESMMTDEEWLENCKSVKTEAVMTEVEYKDKVLEVRATMLEKELADTNTTEKRITQIKQQQLDIQLQQKDSSFRKEMELIKTNYDAEANIIRDAYTVNGRVTEEGNRLLLELEIQHLLAKAGLHKDYGKTLLGVNGQIATSNRSLHESNMRQIQEQLGAMSGLGGALQTLAGDNEALNGVKEAGIAISEAASIAQAFLTLQESLNTLGMVKNNVAKALGIGLKTTDVALTNTDSVSTALNTTATTTNTGAVIGNTMADAVSLPVLGTKAILKQGGGDPYTAFFRIIAMIALIAGVMSMFMKKGGLIPSGKEGKFAKGGMVRGKSHAQGGEKFAVGGRVVELEGGEAVINKRSTAMYKDQLSSMNAAGGGNRFADGGLLNMPSFATASFGALSGGSGGSTQKVIVVESDITKTQRKVNVIEAAATI